MIVPSFGPAPQQADVALLTRILPFRVVFKFRLIHLNHPVPIKIELLENRHVPHPVSGSVADSQPSTQVAGQPRP